MSIFFYEGKEYFIPGHLIRKHCFETEDNDYGITTVFQVALPKTLPGS